MSKGSSHLFTNTGGEGKTLIAEVQKHHDKISPEKVLLITRDPNGKIIWLEAGNEKSGLQHIIIEHGSQFNERGIKNEDIPDYVPEAVHQGHVVGTQGKRDPRTLYEFTYNGKKQRIAIQISTNGYIVGANPRSVKEE